MIKMIKATIAIFFMISMFALTACVTGSADVPDNQAATPGEFLQIPLSDITRTAAFFPVAIDGVSMEVVAVKASDDTIRVAFNTCEVCHASGRGYYVQDGDDVICQQCQMRFAIDSIGLEPGGCQPIAISEQDIDRIADYLQISYDLLAENQHWFLNWRN